MAWTIGRSLYSKPNFLGLIILITVSCGGNKSTTPPPPADEPPPGEEPKKTEDEKKSEPENEPPPHLPLTVQPTQDSIQKNLVNQSCLSCHSSSTLANRFIDLTDLAKVIIGDGHIHPRPGEMRRDLVKPGCPKQSFFYSIMREGKMPPPPAKIDQVSLDAVERWIVSLKPNAGTSCNIDNDEPPDPPGGDDEP